MDWNETDPTILGTSSIDTTCTIWNVEVRAFSLRVATADSQVPPFRTA